MLRDLIMLVAICIAVPLVAIGCSYIVERIDRKVKGDD